MSVMKYILSANLGDPVMREGSNPAFTCGFCGSLVARDGMGPHMDWHDAGEPDKNPPDKPKDEGAPPWSAHEVSEPVVFTKKGPVPFSEAPHLIREMELRTRIGKLERLIKLLCDPYARSEPITDLRRELGV